MTVKSFAAAVAVVLSTGAFAGALTEKIARAHKVTRTDAFAGGQRTVFDFEGYEAWVVEPPAGVKTAEGRPWTWTMQWATAFVPRTPVSKLLARGWHHATVITFKHRMDETGLAVSRRFQDYLVNDLGLAKKTCLIGMSWGGFFSTRYMAKNPGCVKAICYDAPLLCFGKYGPEGPWKDRVPADGWRNSPEMPVNMAAAVAAQRIPVLHLYGGCDTLVPPAENTDVFLANYRRAGGEEIKVVNRPLYGHHPHGVEVDDPSVANFFEKAFRAPDPDVSARFSVFQFAVKRVMKDRGVDLAGAAKLLAAAGVTGFDTNYDDAEIPAFIQAGLKPSNFYGDVKFDSPDNGKAQAEKFVDTAVKYGCRRVMVLVDSFKDGADAAERERVTQRIVAGLRTMTAYGRRKGVVVTIEDFGNVRNICSYASGMSRLFDSVPALDFAIDSGNLYYAGRGDDIVALGRKYQKRIAHVHLKNQTKANNRQYAPLDDGAVPNAEVLALVKETGYAGWYTIENPVGDDYLADIERSVKFIRACLNP